MVPWLKLRCICLQIHTCLQCPMTPEGQPSLHPGLLQLKKHLLLWWSWAPPSLPHTRRIRNQDRSQEQPQRSSPSLTLMFIQHHLRSAGCTAAISPLHLTHSSDCCYLIPSPQGVDEERGSESLSCLPRITQQKPRASGYKPSTDHLQSLFCQ